jgi:integrase
VSVTCTNTAVLATILAHTPQRFHALVTLAAWSALRFGEQTELRRGDIDDDGEHITVHIRRGVVRLYADKQAGQPDRFIIGEPKTEKSKRDPILPPGASQVLRQHLIDHVGPGDDALLFPGKDKGTTHLASGSHKEWWYPARAAAGRTDLPWHGLRHYGLTKYAQAGATLAELQARAGHTTVTAMMRYQHDADDVRRRELARRMENL